MKARALACVSIALLFTLCGALPLCSQDAAKKKSLAVFPFANKTGSESYGAACDAAANSLLVTLKSLEGYQVQVLGADPAERSEEALAAWAEDAKVDVILYGQLTLNAEGKVQASLAAFDRLKAATIVTKKSAYVRLMDIFHTSDALVVDVLTEMTGKHIGFARLEFHNSGQEGSYEVAIDGKAVGKDLDSIAGWREGKHEIILRQKRMLGEFELYRQTLTLVEGKTAEVDFSLPLITADEKSSIDDLESKIRTNWDREEEASEVDSLLAQYSSLFKDLDFCPALSAYRDKAAKLASDWTAQKQALADRARQEREVQLNTGVSKVETEISRLELEVSQLEAAPKTDTDELERTSAESRAALDSLTRNLRVSFSAERDKALAQLKLRNSLDGGGWISFALCIAGAAGAGASYYLGSQAFTDYQAATTNAQADSARSSMKLYMIGLYAGAGLGGLGLVLSPILFCSGPSRGEAQAAKVESEIMLKALDSN